MHVSAVAVPNHEPSGDGQHRTRSQAGCMDRDPPACSDLDSPDDRPHFQPYLQRHGPGCQRYEKITDFLVSSCALVQMCKK